MAWPLSQLLGDLLHRSRNTTQPASRGRRRRIRLEAEPLEPRWVPSLTTLWSFGTNPITGVSNGANPESGIIVTFSHILGTQLVGTTNGGGANGVGEVFKVSPGNGSPPSIATAALSASLGENPVGNLIEDSFGNFIGTASAGGSGGGTVFELTTAGTLTDLAKFGDPNGADPQGGVVEDSGGNLFGTTQKGGALTFGTVYEVRRGTGAITTLASFEGAEATMPVGSLVTDGQGDLFGSTTGGSTFSTSLGTVFELKVGSSMVSTLATFGSGEMVDPGLVEDSGGNLFGTTEYGGAGTSPGDGTVFELTPGGQLLTPEVFNGTNGANPLDGVIEDSSGNFYGTTSKGGVFGEGTVFEVPAGSKTIVTLHSFDGSDGANPQSTLTEDSFGDLYGTTYNGGGDNMGTVFELAPPQITTPALAHWTVNVPGYSETISAINGTGPYLFTASGSLPPGLTLNNTTGVISGTPTAAGTYLFTVTATDSQADDPLQTYIVTINPPLAITSVVLPSGTTGTAYNQTIATSGGTAPLTFAATGTLPPGLTLSSGGVLAGTPTTAGSYTFMVTATDAVGGSVGQTYTVTINQPFTQYQVATLLTSPTVTAGSPFLVTVQAVDASGNPVTSYSGPPTVTAQVSPTSSASSFPLALSIGSNGQGQIAAVLQTAGTYTLTASGGSFTSNAVTVTVTPGPAAKLAFAVQPASTLTGVALPAISVQVQDAFGNLIISDNSDIVSLSVASGPPGAPGFAAGSTTMATVTAGTATFSNLTLIVPGTYTLAAVVPNHFIGTSAAFPIIPLQVVPGSFVGTPSGFSLQFNVPFLVNAVTPVLYGQGFGATAPVPSVTLTQFLDSSGNPVNIPVVGSLVPNTASNTITFLATNTSLEGSNGSPLLPDGTYVVVLHSSAAKNGFQALNPAGGFLDGLGNGTPGSGNFTALFTVGAASAKDDVVWVPATADGPGQALNAPGMNQVGGGYPIYLNDTTGAVTNVQVTLNYNSALLTVTGATGAGFSFLGTSTPGQAVLQYSGPALPAGKQTPIGFLTATVPSGTTSNPMPYKAKDLLHLSNVSLNGGAIVVTTSDGLHLVAYVGDADGNGAYSANDAVLITRALLQSDSGFVAYPLVDPVIVGDTDGSAFIPADAALQVNEAGVGATTANLPIPPIPTGVHFQALAQRVSPSVRTASAVQVGTTTSFPDLTALVDYFAQAGADTEGSFWTPVTVPGPRKGAHAR